MEHHVDSDPMSKFKDILNATFAPQTEGSQAANLTEAVLSDMLSDGTFLNLGETLYPSLAAALTTEQLTNYTLRIIYNLRAERPPDKPSFGERFGRYVMRASGKIGSDYWFRSSQEIYQIEGDIAPVRNRVQQNHGVNRAASKLVKRIQPPTSELLRPLAETIATIIRDRGTKDPTQAIVDSARRTS